MAVEHIHLDLLSQLFLHLIVPQQEVVFKQRHYQLVKYQHIVIVVQLDQQEITVILEVQAELVVIAIQEVQA